MTEEYAQTLTDKVESMTGFVLRVNKRYRIMYYCFAGMSLIIFLYLLSVVKTSIFITFNAFANIFLLGLACLFVIEFLIYRLYKACIKKRVEHYNDFNGDVTRQLTNYFTLRGIYDDMTENKMTLIKAEDGGIKVKTIIEGKYQTLILPVKYTVNDGDKNIIRFLNESIDITLDNDSRKDFD